MGIPREQPGRSLGFSGERQTSDIGGQIKLEYFHRYFLARDLCRGKTVLNIASGERYGSAFLSQVAKRVIGVDVDAAAIDHANIQYDRSNLEFVTGSALDIPIPTASVDVVVSLETIEHCNDHDRFLSELKRVLKPGGIFIVSRPERDIYSANTDNIKEMTRPEFRSLLSANFANLHVLVQRVILGSVLVPDGGVVPRLEPLTIDRRGDKLFELSSGLPQAPYMIAIASDKKLPPVRSSFFIENGSLAELTGTPPEERNRVESARLLQENFVDVQRALEEEKSASDKLREDLQAMQDALDEERSASGRLRENLQGARQALDEVRASSANLRDELQVARIEAVKNVAAIMAHFVRANSQAGADRSRMLYDLQETGSRLQQVLKEHDSILTSTTWLATRPVRAVVGRMPSVLRVFCRRVLRIFWWTVTLQLPTRLRHRRRAGKTSFGKARAGLSLTLKKIRKEPIGRQIQHPGEILKEKFLNEIGVSQYQLAQAIGVPGNRIHAIVNGTREITAETDLLLCKYFGLTDGYFLRLQNAYDMFEVKRRIASKLARIERDKSN